MQGRRNIELLIKAGLAPGFQSVFKNVGASNDALKKRMEDLNRQAKNMDGLNRAAQNVRKYQRAMAEARDGIRANAEAQIKQNAIVQKLSASFESQAAEVKKLATAEKNSAGSVTENEKALKALNNEKKRAEASIQKLTSAIARNEEKLKKLEDAEKGETAAAKKAKKAIKDLGAEREKSEKSVESLSSKITKQKTVVKSMAAVLAGHNKNTEKARAIMNRRSKALTKARKELHRLNIQERRLGQTVKRSKTAYHQQVQSLRTYKRSLHSAGIDVQNLRVEQQKLNEELEKTRRRSKMASQARGGGVGAGPGFPTAAVTAGAAAITYVGGRTLKGSVSRAMDFSHILAQIDVISNMGPEKKKQLERQLVSLSGPEKTNLSPVALAKEYQQLVQAGLKGNDVIKALLPIGRTALGHTADPADVSKTAYAFNKNLDIPLSQLKKSLDISATAGDLGKFELKDMAKHLPGLAGIMQSMGQKGEKAVASLGAALQVAKFQTDSSDEAANNLVNFLNKIADQETKKRFAEVGVNVEDEFRKGAAKDDVIGHMIKLVDDISKRARGEEEGSALFGIAELFRDRQVRAFLTPATANLHTYHAFRKKALLGLGESGEAKTDEAYKKMIKEPLEQWRGSMNQVEEMSRQIGKTFIPAFNEAATAMNRGVSLINVGLDKFPMLRKMIGGAGLATLGVAGATTLAAPMLSTAATLYSANKMRGLITPKKLGDGAVAGPRGIPVRVINWPAGMKGGRGGNGGAGATAAAGAAGAGAAGAAGKAGGSKGLAAKGGRFSRMKGSGLTAIAAYLGYEIAKPAIAKTGINTGSADAGVAGYGMGSLAGMGARALGIKAAGLSPVGALAALGIKGTPMAAKDFKAAEKLSSGEDREAARKAQLKAMGWNLPGMFPLKALGIDPLVAMDNALYGKAKEKSLAKTKNDFDNAKYVKGTLPGKIQSGFSSILENLVIKPMVELHVNANLDQTTPEAVKEAANDGMMAALRDPQWLEELVQKIQFPLAELKRDLMYDGGGR